MFTEKKYTDISKLLERRGEESRKDVNEMAFRRKKRKTLLNARGGGVEPLFSP